MRGDELMETLKFVMVTTHYPPQHVGGDAMMVKHISDELTKRGMKSTYSTTRVFTI